MNESARRPRASTRTTKSLSALLCLLLLPYATVTSQTADPTTRIRDAALNHSQLMDIAGHLTDVIGPRLTGSPSLRRAEEYARDKLLEWGVANAHLEAWGPFGRGWSLEGFTAIMLSPGFSPLIAYPKAWSPGTNGAVRGEAVFLDVKTAAGLERYKGKLKGKIVLFSPARQVDPLFEPPAQRQTDEELLRLANAQPPDASQPFHFTPEQRAAEDLNFRKWQFVQSEGAAVVLQPAYRDGGTVYVTAATVPYPPDVPFAERAHPWDAGKTVAIPQVSVAAEQYNRMVRLAARGIPVELEVNIAVRFYDDDPMSYNVIAEIPGTDLKDELVMLGGSIDSWHAGTGATDNAGGAATALEIMRILRSLDLKPRRTIRIGLWSAEEQGSLGSRAYVAAHLLKPEAAQFDAYFNFDYGTGRIRGIYLQGNEGARPVFRALLEPFRDLGASTLSIAGVGSTDHIPFDEAGLPAFQWIRDYMEGQNTRASHTNMDTYDHLLEDDLKQSAAVGASVVYGLAMRDEKLPRKPRPAP
ncbi:MAG TPA: M20/M25/M40 family metallo-hydrolase [Candidatus Acidoferrales bacterium]|nr:M20/M25/M40 family metallo-hydrolase [Candidatus Acidoferrales bacterium]